MLLRCRNQPGPWNVCKPFDYGLSCINLRYILGASVTLNRFWKTVSVTENDGKFFVCKIKQRDELITKLPTGILTVTLDGRPLRTPEGAKLEIPKSHRLLAALVATEWENQEKLIKPHALPMVSKPR